MNSLSLQAAMAVKLSFGVSLTVKVKSLAFFFFKHAQAEVVTFFV